MLNLRKTARLSL